MIPLWKIKAASTNGLSCNTVQQPYRHAIVQWQVTHNTHTDIFEMSYTFPHWYTYDGKLPSIS